MFNGSNFLKQGTELLDKGTTLFEKVGNKISDVKENLLDYIPETNYDYITNKLESIGYKVPKIEIKLSLPPSVLIEIDLDNSVINEINKKEIEENIDFENEKETETNKVLYKILQGLDYAAKVNNKIIISNKKMSRVIIEGSLIPSVKLVYLDKDINSNIYQRDMNN